MELLIADSALWQLGGTLGVILKVAVGLGLVIFVHELGHFLVAKICGVKCEKFYVGFDVPIRIGPLRLPRTLWRAQWGETEYGIGIIPLGGYVKMLGQDDNPANAEAEAERTRVRKAPASGYPEDGQKSEEYELDPRSYPAKSVPQRMAIISAGVIMNVIFAAVFAAIAYMMGVSYTPTVVARAAPGSPAWINNLQPGDRILQIGRDDKRTEHLRFGKDLMPKVFFNGADKELDFLVRRVDGQEEWVTIQPTTTVDRGRERPVIGISPTESLTLGADLPVWPGFPAADLSLGFQPEDQVVSVDGQKVERFAELEAIMAARPGETLTFTVERKQPKEDQQGAVESPQPAKRVEISVPPTPRRTLGLVMKTGPVVAVRVDSPADVAGFQKGDVILSVAGEPLGDPFTLSERMLLKVGESIPVDVRRGKQTVQLTVTPRAPEAFHPVLTGDTPLPVEPLGLALEISNEVAAVDPGSPADRAGIQSGDEITQVEFLSLSDEEEDESLEAKKRREVLELLYYPPKTTSASRLAALFAHEEASRPFDLTGDAIAWPAIESRLQYPLRDLNVRLTLTRGDEQVTTSAMTPTASGTWHVPERGLRFAALEEIHTAESFSEAVMLGLRETKEQLSHVLIVLYKLITGQLSPTNLGGPLTIAAVAGSEASVSIPRLLIFLTFLSANLAIVNFLPIPVLDGGHMLFLVLEGIRGKPVDEQLVMKFTMGGLMFILGLMIFVFGLDIGRLTGLVQ